MQDTNILPSFDESSFQQLQEPQLAFAVLRFNQCKSNVHNLKRSSEMRNESYIPCHVLSLWVLNEFILNENIIECIYGTLIKFVAQTLQVAVKYFRSRKEFTSQRDEQLGNRIRRETDQDVVTYLKLENGSTKLSLAIFVGDLGQVLVWYQGLFQQFNIPS